MPRPRRFRRVLFEPNVTYFKPAGVRMIDLDDSIITVDEFEAVRLKDLEGFDQDECAKKMKISQPTFNRLISLARKKIADAIVNGKAIKIEGGNFMIMQARPGRGMGRGMGFGRMGQGRGRMGGPFAAGPGGMCKCPNCGTVIGHHAGVPCVQQKCPKCGTMMVRGE